jgi:diphthamide synthase (EF-2-diphthine--ammonia ligase)
VLDGPLFKKRLRIDGIEIIEEKNAARMVVKKASLVDK